jgi:hypothetical protein
MIQISTRIYNPDFSGFAIRPVSMTHCCTNKPFVKLITGGKTLIDISNGLMAFELYLYHGHAPQQPTQCIQSKF